MIEKDSPKVEAKDWFYARLTKDTPDYLANHAPIDGLLAMFHSGAKAGALGTIELEFLKTLLAGRYTQAQIQSMERLTGALNRASKSSTIIGIGLVAMAVASAAVAVLAYLK